MAITLKDLISSLPVSKQRHHLGDLFLNSTKAFYHTDSLEDTIDKVNLSFIEKIIISKDFIKDLELWRPELIAAICGEINQNIATVLQSNDRIRQLLISYFNISQTEFGVENTPLQTNVMTICQSPLYEYQERIRRKVINLIFNNTERFLIHMPTGSGKTRTAGEIILDFLRLSSSKALLTENIKILWIAQSEELLLQAAQTINEIVNLKATRTIALKHFYKNHSLNDDVVNEPAIIFCGIQKLMNHYQSGIWNKIRNQTYLIIVDEAHRSVAENWVNILRYFVDNQNVYLLGLTATPGIGNGDTHLLASMYRNNKISITDEKYSDIDRPVQYLVERGFLSQIQRHVISSDCILEDVACANTVGEFEFSNETLMQLTADKNRNESIINIIVTHSAQNKKILVFTCSVNHNMVLQNILLNRGVTVESIDAKSKDRQSVISRFKDGDLNVLLNFNVLTTGFDAPNTNICIIARPITSIVQYSQIVGRIARGNKDLTPRTNILYTIRDNFNHGGYDELFGEFDNFYI